MLRTIGVSPPEVGFSTTMYELFSSWEFSDRCVSWGELGKSWQLANTTLASTTKLGFRTITIPDGMRG